MRVKSFFLAAAFFITGYLANDFVQNPVEQPKPESLPQQDCVSQTTQEISSSLTTETSQSELMSSAATHSVASQPSHETQHVKDEPESISSSGSPIPATSKSESSATNVITDAEIDAILPAPFNTQLKSIQGQFRDKYKDFANAEQPDDWDIRMRGHLADGIMSNPYAKFITIESLICKIGICEIRMYETKHGAWSIILAEMQVQSWWEFSNVHSAGFGTHIGSEIVTGQYVLIERQPH